MTELAATRVQKRFAMIDMRAKPTVSNFQSGHERYTIDGQKRSCDYSFCKPDNCVGHCRRTLPINFYASNQLLVRPKYKL